LRNIYVIAETKVTSNCLCKKGEGVVLPLLIEVLKDRIDDSLHAFDGGTPVIVQIPGYGPTDTVYFDPANDPGSPKKK
jgi:hypothetical protein